MPGARGAGAIKPSGLPRITRSISAELRLWLSVCGISAKGFEACTWGTGSASNCAKRLGTSCSNAGRGLDKLMGASVSPTGSWTTGGKGCEIARRSTPDPWALTKASIPVATTDTRIEPSMVVSSVEPTIILASGSTFSRIILAASSSSNKVRSYPPVILIKTPRAPFRLISSSSGLAMAFSAACTARFSPEASPVPIMAFPISSITARTSAKSRLMRPGRTIRSVTPLTP